MKKRFVFLSIAFVLATGMVHLFAQTTTQPETIATAQAGIATTQPGTITLYATGWFADQVRVETTASFVPNGCFPDTDGYITNPSDPANLAHQAALLGAFLAGKTVVLQLQGCYIGRPQILGVIACASSPGAPPC
jgi:hypothetical protein